MVYHYCSVNSFFNIIKSKAIRLSSYRFMNDSAELSWANQQFEEFALNDFKTSPFYCCCNGFEGIEAYKLLLHTLLLQKKHSFIASFSDCADSLSQWRGYAEDGQGVSIGLKSLF